MMQSARSGAVLSPEVMSHWIVFILVVLYLFIVISSAAVVVAENKNPIRAISWTLAILFLPIIGLIFYFFFGRSLKESR